MMLRSFAFLCFSLSVAVQGDIVLFPWLSNDGSFGNAADAVSGFGNTQPITAACAAALNQTVSCDPQMQLLAGSGYVISLNGTDNSLCGPGCNASLVAYRSAVTSACGASGAFDTYPNTWRADLIYDYFNMVCDKDPGTGLYCPQWLGEQYAANGNPQLEDLPASILCSHCQLDSMRTVQNSAFLGYNDAMVNTYQTIFTKCGQGVAGTPKPPPQTTPPNSPTGTNRTCASGQTYTAQPGDTCHSIALAKSCSENTLASINDLLADCSRLQLQNQTAFELCLPNTCETAQTSANDTCWSISAEHNITFAQFQAYNPAINSDCSNLRTDGTVVCISSPDGSYTPVSLPGSNSTWIGGEYADNVVNASGATPFGTTTNCGSYYQVQVADTCKRISLAAQVSVELFQLVNPSIDGACDNLVPGLWYCTHPTYDWNVTIATNGTATPSSTTLPPPAATPTGTTTQCYKWHVIAANETCSLLQNTLGLTMAQLVAWNPSLKADCTNLVLGDAYCVQGPAVSTTASTTTATSTTKASSSTTTAAPTTSTAAACSHTYTVVSGDYCSLLWTRYSLTEAQFRALNPALDAACDLGIGQVLCVAGPTPSSSSTTTTTTTTTPPTSSPTGSTCAQTYTVISGDYCAKIWAQYTLTEAQFRALNPSLDAACDLAIGQVLCVKGTSGSTGTGSGGGGTSCKTYTVVSGDYCSKIWGQYGLTEAQFRALNPGVDAACDLLVGEVVCVG